MMRRVAPVMVTMSAAVLPPETLIAIWYAFALPGSVIAMVDSAPVVDVIDAETAERVAVSLSHDSVRSYTAAVQAWLADCAARCRSRGAAYQLVPAEQPIAEVVLGGLREHGVAR